MGTRTSHAPATISWVDLSTTDFEAAKRFFAPMAELDDYRFGVLVDPAGATVAIYAGVYDD